MRRRLATAALIVGFAACGGRQPDLVVHGTPVIIDTEAPFAHDPDFPARLESTLAAALAYWGGTWDALSTTTITLSGAAYVPCGGNLSALGCYDGDIRVSTSDPGAGPFDCVEQTVLVHEVGHAVLGDRLHEDPRWMQFSPLEETLSGRTGHGGAGEAACEIFVSVWRHPLGTP